MPFGLLLCETGQKGTTRGVFTSTFRPSEILRSLPCGSGGVRYACHVWILAYVRYPLLGQRPLRLPSVHVCQRCHCRVSPLCIAYHHTSSERYACMLNSVPLGSLIGRVLLSLASHQVVVYSISPQLRPYGRSSRNSRFSYTRCLKTLGLLKKQRTGLVLSLS